MIANRYAILFEDKNNLELKVYSNRKEAEQEIKAFDKNPSRNSLGFISFNDNRSPVKILKSFSAIYLSTEEVMKSSEEELFSSVSYPLRYRDFLINAFGYYFSNRDKKKVEDKDDNLLNAL